MTDDRLNDRYPRSGPDNDNRDPSRDRKVVKRSDEVRTDWFKRGDINKSREV